MSQKNLGKHFILSLSSSSLSNQDRSLLSEIKPAGIFLDGSNFLHKEKYEVWHKALSDLIHEAKSLIGRKNIIIALDHEGGRVHRTPAPITHLPPAELYKSFADLAGEVHAKELNSLGVNLLFGPVCDINSNFENPVIGARSFGKTSEEVLKAATLYIAELSKKEILTCPKHFPGHGDTYEDSHTDFPCVELTKKELFERELKPFAQMAKEKVPAIMTSHVLFKALDAKYPATLSKTILTDILREEIGYEGVVISDDMDMRAMSDNFSDTKLLKLALSAGCDIFLFNHNPERAYKFVEIIEQGLNDGTVEKEVFSKSSKRVDAFLAKVKESKPQLLRSEIFEKHKAQIALAMSDVGSDSLNYFTKEGVKLKDPEPSLVKPPSKEPKLRVGIVIEEDNKKEITFTCPSDAIGMLGDSTEIQLEANVPYLVKVSSNFLAIYANNEKLKEIKGFLKVKLKNETELKPNSGIKVENIIAGRHFHWKKEVAQTLPGILEFIPDVDRIILVNTIGFEFYVTCVVASEMGKNCPKEFCKAQATAARSWARVYLGNKYPGKAYTLCNDDVSQRYQGSSFLSQDVINFVKECYGDYLVSEDENVVPAFYSKSTGGHGEDCELAFNFKAPGLKAKFDCEPTLAPNLTLSNEKDFKFWLEAKNVKENKLFCSPECITEKDLPKYLGAVDEQGKYFRWEHTTNATTITNKLKNKFLVNDISYLKDIVLGKRGLSGRILNLKIKYLNSKNQEKEIELTNEYNIRLCFHDSFLFSSAFTFNLEKDSFGNILKVKFLGAGWGHGIGLCQIGALGMALEGKSYEDILSHYFPDAELFKAY